MNKVKKRGLSVLLVILAVVVLALIAFVGLYFTRIQTIGSMERLTDYADGYNLYRMDVKYDYSLDNMIDYGIKDDQTMIDAILKEALPLLPVKIKAPNFGCTAFTLTDTDGGVHMGRNYDFKKEPLLCWFTVHRRTDISLLPLPPLTMLRQRCLTRISRKSWRV